jgi:hypothetical protein
VIGLDWYGVAAVIAAIGGATATILTALANRKVSQVHNEVKTPNGTLRTSGEVQADIAKAVGADEPAG